MFAAELINAIIPPLKPTDKVEMALSWMEELRVNQLPVIENGHYLGLITGEMLYDANEPDADVGSFDLLHKDIWIKENQHFYELIKIASDFGIQVIAVKSEQEEFLGVITINDTVNALSRTCATQSPGSIIVVSMHSRDYVLAEIARLIEEDGVKILSTYLENDQIDYERVKLTVKMNVMNCDRAVATLERFGYRIIARFQESDSSNNEKERLDLLFRYLDL